MAKAPNPKTVARQKRAGIPDLIITVDGTEYPFRFDEVTGEDAGLFRRHVGMSVQRARQAFVDDPDIDLVAGFVWLARLQGGQSGLPFVAVAKGITYESAIEFDFEPTEPSEGDDPEA